jgi:hypothetical protein
MFEPNFNDKDVLLEGILMHSTAQISIEKIIAFQIDVSCVIFLHCPMCPGILVSAVGCRGPFPEFVKLSGAFAQNGL